MRRIDPATLQQNIAIQLRVLRGPVKRGLGIQGDAATEMAAQAIVERCLGGCVVLAPDMVPAGDWGQKPGKFGVTEPWPDGSEPPG